jgi:lipopolysaccharide transport system permease protein
MNKITGNKSNSDSTTCTFRERFIYSDFLNYQFDVIVHLVVRKLLIRYKGTIFGVLWLLLTPLSQLLVFTFIFGRVVPLNIEAYPAFLFIGILPWTWFSTCLTNAGRIFIDNRDLMRKPNFNPPNLVFEELLTNLLTFSLLLPILLLLLIMHHREFTIYVIIVPFLMIIQGLLILGLSMIISTLNVFYRDIHHVVGLGIMLMFYTTPVFYTTQNIDSKYHVIFKYNPMSILIEGYRQTCYYGMPPDWVSIFYAGTFSIITCLIGYGVYRRHLHKLYDFI